ncbi:hypothetical protein C8R44DRAFT_848635 [Mycena epipterygia]|nr:hypothetical protein C8R44DRAFT_848635 [Mycena epipterygia]
MLVSSFLREALLLLRIYRAWRTLVLSVPALGATLNVGTLPLDREAPGEMEGIVATWFSRASALPLSLTWYRGNVEPQINATIRRYSPRLQCLQLAIFTDDLSHLIDSLSTSASADVQGSAPAAACSVGANTPFVSAPPECLDILRAAPSLRKFDFYGSDNNSFDDDEPMLGNNVIFRTPGSGTSVFWESFGSGGRDLPSIFVTIACIAELYFFLERDTRTIHGMPQCTANFVRALNREYEREFLPTLQNLTLTGWKTDEVDMQLLDALEARCTGIKTEDEHGARMQLKSFRLIWATEYPGATIPP